MTEAIKSFEISMNYQMLLDPSSTFPVKKSVFFMHQIREKFPAIHIESRVHCQVLLRVSENEYIL